MHSSGNIRSPRGASRDTHLEKMKNRNVSDLVKTPPSKRGSDQPDPYVLHHYDNFYHTTKSLLVLFQIMGVMPIERELGRTTYR